jgi:SPP1 gp7 family putative phage head morphogenesis protein
VQAFLDDQKAEIAAKVREKGEHIARKPSDTDAWWSGKWDAKLMEALRRGLAGVTETVATRIGQQVPAKADPFAEAVLQALLRTVAKRVTGINTTTRDAIASIIGKAFSDGLSPAQVADLITEATPFDTSRAEVIARTETAYAYNGAAVESYREVGVEKVEVIDGDGDDECQAADGQVWTLDEANDNPLGHPNCVRDFAPVFGGA